MIALNDAFHNMDMKKAAWFLEILQEVLKSAGFSNVIF